MLDNIITTQFKRARFRFDASHEIGLGHAYRCLTLAKALAEQNWTIDFAITETTRRIFKIEVGTILPIPDNLAVSQESEYIEKIGGAVDLLVIDHYDRDHAFEKNSRTWAKKIFVIDDLANRRHECDFLLDQTFGLTAAAYEELVPRSCKLLLGSAYALLRRQFALKRFFAPITSKACPPQNILISLGGTDPKNMTDLVIRAIHATGLKVNVHIIGGQEFLGTKFSNLNISRYNDVVDMASLFMMADIAIGASGMSAWERCCLGLPTVLMVTADNQRANAIGLSTAGAVKYLGVADDLDFESIATGISELTQNPNAIVLMQNKARLVADGLGAGRVICEIEQEFEDHQMGICLRLATRADLVDFYLWQREAVGKIVVLGKLFSSCEAYVSCLEAGLYSPHCNLNIIQLNGVSIGVLRADADLDRQHFEISMLLDDSICDLNVGRIALCLLSKQQPWARLAVQLDVKNKSLVKMFLEAGFNREGQENRFVKQPKVGDLC